MNCAISGRVPDEPVISRKSGIVFEKRLIVKHIEAIGSCPVTKEPLSVEDLLTVRSQPVVTARPVSLTSVPSMVGSLMNEWDSLMLETYELKSTLHSTRQQLSQVLYENDACFRVIARLIHERDTYKNALEANGGQAAQPSATTAAAVSTTTTAASSSSSSMDTAEDGSSAAATAVTGVTAQKLTQIIDTTMTRLNSVRSSTVKALQKAAYTVDELGKQALVSSHPLHAVRNAGITCVAVSPTDDTLVATGGNDKQVIVFARTKKKKVATLKGHTGAITSVDFGKTENTYRLLASAGGNEAKVWKAMTGTFKNNMTPIYTTACHDGEVRACFHPSDELLFTASHDQSWAVHDLATQTVMGKVLSSTTTDAPYVDLAVHPDGFLLGVATSNKIPIFDVKSNGVAALLEGHTGNVTKIAFSENGYHLASGDSDGVVKVWDLRKRLCLKTFEHKGISEVTALAFDPSATYLSFGGITGVAATYKVKKRDAVVAEWQHSGAATGIAYGTGSRSFLASVSLDRKLNFYSVV